MELPGISKGKIQLAASLSSRKIRRKEGLFVAEGRKCVADTIDSFDLEFLAAGREWAETHGGLIDSLTDKYGACLYSADESELRKMSSLQTPPEVIAVYRIPALSDEDLTRPLPDGLYLMLDSIQDPGNLGTIIRAAHWFGVTRIFASPMTADIYNPKTIQATMGSIAAVRVDYTDLGLICAHNPQLPVIGLQLNGENIYKAKLPQKGFIVMGNEGNGLSPGMKESIDVSLTIPPYDASSHPESLNVAVATAITLSMIRKNFFDR